MAEKVNHPPHYGGDVTYEAIKVIEAWRLGFCLGNAAKYICRAGKKPGQEALDDLRKAAWYLNREVARLEAVEAEESPTESTAAAVDRLYGLAPPRGDVPVCVRCRQLLYSCRKWAAGIGLAPGHADPLTSPCEGSGVLPVRRMTDVELSAWNEVRGQRLWCSPVFAPFPSGFAVVVEDMQPQSGLIQVRRAEEFQGEGAWPNEPFYVTATELTLPQRTFQYGRQKD